MICNVCKYDRLYDHRLERLSLHDQIVDFTYLYFQSKDEFFHHGICIVWTRVVQETAKHIS